MVLKHDENFKYINFYVEYKDFDQWKYNNKTTIIYHNQLCIFYRTILSYNLLIRSYDRIQQCYIVGLGLDPCLLKYVLKLFCSLMYNELKLNKNK